MAEIRVHREHQLGLARARQVAARWAEEVEQRFEMRCTVTRGQFSDTVAFARSGVNGRLIVAADHFDLDAKLGLLLGVFSRTIETEILRNLDDLLAHPPDHAPKPRAAGGNAAARKRKRA